MMVEFSDMLCNELSNVSACIKRPKDRFKDLWMHNMELDVMTPGNREALFLERLI